MASVLTDRLGGVSSGVPVNAVLAAIQALTTDGLIYLDFDVDGNPTASSLATGADGLATTTLNGLMPAVDKAVLDSFKFATDYFQNSSTTDQLTAMNDLVADINADDFGVVIFPHDFHVAYSTSPDMITGSNWGFYCPGRAYFHILETAGAAGCHLQLGDDLTGTSCNDWIIDGFEFANDNYRTETGSRWQIECRVAARGQIRNCTTDNGLFVRLGWPGGYDANSIKILNIVTTANSGLPNAVFDLVSAAACTIDNVQCDADGRSVIRNASFTAATYWVYGTGWTRDSDPLSANYRKAVKAVSAGQAIVYQDNPELVGGAVYDLEFILASYSGSGNIKFEIIGDTTVSTANYSSNGTKTTTITGPANPTRLQFVADATVGVVLDAIVMTRVVHDSYRPMLINNRDSSGNIDGLHVTRFIANGEAEKHCLEINYSYGEIGNIFLRDCFLELSTDSPLYIHSANGTTGFLRNYQFNSGRISGKLAVTEPSVKINTGTSVAPLKGQFNNVDFLGGQGEFVKVTTTNVTDPVSISINNNHFYERNNGAGSLHSAIKSSVGLQVQGNYHYVGETNSTFVKYTSRVEKFVEFTANVPSFMITDNFFPNIVGTEGIDVSLVTDFPSKNYVVAGNVGPTIHNDSPYMDGGAVGDGTTSDSAALQSVLTAGRSLRLDPRKTYLLTTQLSITTAGTGIEGNRAVVKVSTASGHFRETDYANRYAATAVPIYATGLDSVFVKNCRFSPSAFRDDEYIQPIYLLNCDNAEVSGNEIKDFGRGPGSIVYNQCRNLTIKDNHIHHRYTNTATGDAAKVQITGILGDENTSVRSDGVKIHDNIIEHLLVGPVTYAAYGCQSDGINICGNKAKDSRNHVITNNTIRWVGDGVDLFCNDAIVTGNLFEYCFGQGVKVIHGGSRNDIALNIFRWMGKTGVSINASNNSGVGDCDSNHIHANDFNGWGWGGSWPAGQTGGALLMWDITANGVAQSITAIAKTSATSCTVTYSGADTYVAGDRIWIDSVLGMVEINGADYVVTSVNTGANTILITTPANADWGAYTSGGTIREGQHPWIGGEETSAVDIFLVTNGPTWRPTNTLVDANKMNGMAIGVYGVRGGSYTGGAGNNLVKRNEISNVFTGKYTDTNADLVIDGGSATIVTAASYTILDTDTAIICDRAGTVTLGFPNEARNKGRVIPILTRQAFTVVAGLSVVIGPTGGAAGTAVLPATAGATIRLRSNGTAWVAEP